MLIYFPSRTRFPRPFFEVQLFSQFYHLSCSVLASQYFASDTFSSHTSQSSDILGMPDTQLLTVFRCSIGCNFNDLKPCLIAGFSSAISSCCPCLCIPVSSLPARACVQHNKSAQNRPDSKGECFLMTQHSVSAQLELAQGLMEGE